MTSTQFTVDPADEGFYITVAGNITVYEEYADAVNEIQTKLAGDSDTFLAELTIEANGEDDVAVALEQVSWQQVIRDMAPDETS